MLKMWLSFFMLGVVDGAAAAEGDAAAGAGAGEGDGAAAADAGDGVDDLDLGDDAAGAGDDAGAGAGDSGAGEDSQRGPTRREQAVIQARRRAQEAEAERDRLRAELEATRRGSVPGGAPMSEEDRLFQQEEARLAAKETTDLERWQIQSNRTIRAANARAARAEMGAADTADRTAFAIACQSNKRMAYVKDQVEQELVKMRQAGQNAPRESIAYFLLGKLAASAKPRKKEDAGSTVDRGKMPAARSDVSARGSGRTEREKRKARLEGVPI